MKVLIGLLGLCAISGSFAQTSSSNTESYANTNGSNAQSSAYTSAVGNQQTVTIVTPQAAAAPQTLSTFSDQHVTMSGTTTQNINTSGTTTQNINTTGTSTQNINTTTSGTTTQNLNTTTSGTTTQNLNTTLGGTSKNIVEYTGSYTMKNVPSVNGPNLTTSNDTCMGSSSGSANGPGFGVSFGSTWTDEHCKRLKMSRELWNKGMKAASLAMDCMDPSARLALEITGTKCPQSMTLEERRANYGADVSGEGAPTVSVRPAPSSIAISTPVSSRSAGITSVTEDPRTSKLYDN
ncbi:hypothetical protein V8Z74_21980 [Comamonas sp. w2-DMI]|uniref:hypothetical protein n=1 Tax=Comamonas sp. w2-DMI TaxID=3126391 RepID=UPI0032E3D589